MSVTLCIALFQAKSCTSVFLAGKVMFYYLSIQTLLLEDYRLTTKRTGKKPSKKTRA